MAKNIFKTQWPSLLFRSMAVTVLLFMHFCVSDDVYNFVYVGSLFMMKFLVSISSFAIILVRKRELVVFL